MADAQPLDRGPLLRGLGGDAPGFFGGAPRGVHCGTARGLGGGGVVGIGTLDFGHGDEINRAQRGPDFSRFENGDLQLRFECTAVVAPGVAPVAVAARRTPSTRRR
ncbi:MAG: hypothetical protein IPJ65_27070 [Archangiaceae bacterium]|nr:hypothetical protein [Archangiaceae bacterium]